eukprot:TRINITY_DN18061_c0_g1_i2.p1 TRINITY_DN18061_c0_g1~~TRINITY_DN18061_c0_g1_i2.p1  ORF type:complete len:762 (+),score=142.12 TRINITY_DN18061_c0_g1_i2:74-2359(+)
MPAAARGLPSGAQREAQPAPPLRCLVPADPPLRRARNATPPARSGTPPPRGGAAWRSLSGGRAPSPSGRPNSPASLRGRYPTPQPSNGSGHYCHSNGFSHPRKLASDHRFVPYSPDDMQRLERAALVFLFRLGVLRAPHPGGVCTDPLKAPPLSSEPAVEPPPTIWDPSVMHYLRNGTLLCSIVGVTGGPRIVGVFEYPRVRKTCVANIRKACEALRERPGMSHVYLAAPEEVYEGNLRVILPLLEDIMRCGERKAPRRRRIAPGDRPYISPAYADWPVPAPAQLLQQQPRRAHADPAAPPAAARRQRPLASPDPAASQGWADSQRPYGSIWAEQERRGGGGPAVPPILLVQNAARRPRPGGDSPATRRRNSPVGRRRPDSATLPVPARPPLATPFATPRQGDSSGGGAAQWRSRSGGGSPRGGRGYAAGSARMQQQQHSRGLVGPAAAASRMRSNSAPSRPRSPPPPRAPAQSQRGRAAAPGSPARRRGGSARQEQPPAAADARRLAALPALVTHGADQRGLLRWLHAVMPEAPALDAGVLAEWSDGCALAELLRRLDHDGDLIPGVTLQPRKEAQRRHNVSQVITALNQRRHVIDDIRQVPDDVRDGVLAGNPAVICELLGGMRRAWGIRGSTQGGGAGRRGQAAARERVGSAAAAALAAPAPGASAAGGSTAPTPRSRELQRRGGANTSSGTIGSAAAPARTPLQQGVEQRAPLQQGADGHHPPARGAPTPRPGGTHPHAVPHRSATPPPPQQRPWQR